MSDATEGTPVHHVFDASTGETVETPLSREERAEQVAAHDAATETVRTERRRAAKRAVRQLRDRYLAQTDALMLPDDALPTDMPDAVKAAISANRADWTAWRQALRDLPATIPNDLEDASEVEWPGPPASPPLTLT